MKKPLLLLFFLSCIASFCLGQEIKKSQPDSLIKIIPDGRHVLFTVGGRLQSPYDIKMRLLSYTPSANEYHAAKTNLIWGFALSGGSGLASIGAVAAFAHDNKLNGVTFNSSGTGFVYQQHNKTGAYILTGAAVGLLTAAIITFVNGSKHAKKAIWLYNLRFQ